MKNQILVLLITALSFTACSKNDDMAPNPQNYTGNNEKKNDCITQIGIVSNDVTDNTGTHLAVSVNWNNPNNGTKTLKISVMNGTVSAYNEEILVNTTGAGLTSFSLPDGVTYLISVTAYRGGNSNEPQCASVAGYHGN